MGLTPRDHGGERASGPRSRIGRPQPGHLGGDLCAGEHQGQGLGRDEANLLEDGPALDPQAFAEEGTQGAPGHLHGGAAELLVLAQEEVVGADLILGESGRIALVVFAQLADVADVFLFGPLPGFPCDLSLARIEV